MDILTSKFRILSEESRLKILQILQQTEKSVNEIVEEPAICRLMFPNNSNLLAKEAL